ncbi:phenylalanine--tRNA ligase subunit beta [Virgibacillus phasianinus]|uniref:Phenylalanine--tRNA ligase beta subunit n=1 Tax=Virgibacillus phasianinus TaxID=2017483 RepID=A0A220U4H9_9BACI|nr:phenylalanine--tRNA ligase subunit beta [Virgibacillus phasianinus]ASK63017.1 phenylalanine--tRNA ligase subunit beta [Virgibacillus phasianinus]
MLVSLNWLQNYIDIGDITPEDLAEKITKSGIEVEGIEYVAEKSENVVVGYVKSCEQHPNADKLNLCQVDVGDETLQIICGAPNIKQGLKVAVAKPKAVLPGNFKIKKVKLRGIESNGMICSLQELGIAEKYVPKDVADGIFVFPDDVKIGVDVTPLLNLDDAILELGLTPNRADCLSMLGVVYEVGAILDRHIHLPDEAYTTGDGNTKDYISVSIEDAKLAPYYGAFVVKNITVKPSPLWMRNYLMAAGIRPINNVVDITNYVLLEYGQPLHAFDYDRLGFKEILVRQAKDNEQIVTLDDQERSLSSDHLVITNGTKPIALAGVMGGANTEVHDETKSLLVEAAYFNPISVRRTVKDTGLRSESSTRFEKGVDPNRIKRAGMRACQLLVKYADGVVLENPVEVDHLDVEEKHVTITTDEVNKRLGTNISNDEIGSILTKLRFSYKGQNGTFHVTIPTRRGDISIFEDMLEEVARIYGYDNLPFTLPTGYGQGGKLSDRQQLKRDIKGYLQAAGLMETITYSLTNNNYISTFVSPEIEEQNVIPVKLAMPMSEDHSHLRLSSVPELLQTVAYNNARNQSDIAYYELGSVFLSQESALKEQPLEQLRLAGALSGLWHEHQWQQERKPVDFYVLKGIVEGLLDFLNIPVTFKQAKLADMHPGRCAVLSIGEQVVGYLGQVHPRIEQQMDLAETYVFDINLDIVLESYEHVPAYKQQSKYPSIGRDIAFVLRDEVRAGDVKAVIESVGQPLVKNVHIFDVYTGEHLPEGEKSIAYRLLYQDDTRTLKDDEVEESFQAIIEAIKTKFNAYVRS